MSKASRTLTAQSAPSVSIGLRSCGCARRFVPTLPQHSQSAPGKYFSLILYPNYMDTINPKCGNK